MNAIRVVLFFTLFAAHSPEAAPATKASSRLPDLSECGTVATNSVGPFDYRKSAGTEILKNVETNHFNSDVQNLIRGQSSYLAGDLNYVLRAFPNHHRALLVLTRYANKQKSENLQGLGYPVSCWFLRAAEFAPDDPAVYSIFAFHLHNFGHSSEAVKQIQRAVDLGAEDPNMFYNAGLLYFEIGNYAKSLEYAKKAYAGGFPLDGLRQKLITAGKWQD